MPARIDIVHGARACEQRLLIDLDASRARAIHDPNALRWPVRVIVPSTSLRQHLSARIVAHVGHAVAGVAIHTLSGFARFLLDAAGRPALPSTALFPLVVREAARQEPVLASLNELSDGYATVIAAVVDLFDAGFDDAHVEAMDELLEQLRAPASVRDRARGVVRVAARTLDGMRQHRVTRQSTLFAMARDLVDTDPLIVRARALLIHGFADATGIASDFIASLLRTSDTRIYLDHPYDPALSDPEVAGAAFTRRFSERVAGLGTTQVHERRCPIPHLTLLRARGADGEARAIADRIRVLLDGGVMPEGIAVVARNLTPYVIPLRRHFSRLGIPFSAPDTVGPFDATQRRVRALLAVMRQRESAPAERWVQVLGHLPGSTRNEWPTWQTDIQVALHTISAARIVDVAASGPGIAMTATHNDDTDSLDDSAGRVASSKQVADARRVLNRAAISEPAQLLLHAWQAWPQRAPFQVHATHLADLLTRALLWPRAAAIAMLDATVDALGTISGTFSLSYDDFLTLIDPALTRSVAIPAGGQGAGVQVLDVTAARARTYSHLFVVGVNRDVFPRTIVEDPLVPDSLRGALATLLPDLPIKHLGFDEERYLFAQLVSSSPQVTLSWQFLSDDGGAMAPSPLIDRLQLSHRHLEVETVPGLYSLPRSSAAQRDADLPLFAQLAKPVPLRPPYEHAILTGLYGRRDDITAAWEVTLANSHRSSAAPDLGAAARLAIIDEHEGRWRTDTAEDRLGPYYGFVGPPRSTADPRLGKLFITTIESVARCPWRTFIRKILGIQPLPDALESLPAVTALMLGNVVHRTLDRIIRDAIPHAPTVLDASSTQTATRVSWPPAAAVERMLEQEASALAEESGVMLPGLVALMVRHARAYVGRAQLLDWSGADATVAVIGSEMTGAVDVGQSTGTPRTVYFKADRVDATHIGLRLTDYKTGRPMREALLTSIANGTYLQCAAYALGAGHLHDHGRYLYLRPDADAARCSVEVHASATNLMQAFYAAVGIVLNAWENGAFFPRVTEPNGTEFSDCRFCEVRDACLRHDVEYRSRLLRWIEMRDREDEREIISAERALTDAWRLRAKSSAGNGRNEGGE